MSSFAILVVLGLSAVTASPAVRPQVIGGVNATQGEFPFIVSLQNYGFHFCAGTILSEQWILTAGHCVLKAQKKSTVRCNQKIDIFNNNRASHLIPSKMGQAVHKNFSVDHLDFDPDFRLPHVYLFVYDSDTLVHYGNTRLYKPAVYPNNVNVSKYILHPNYTFEENYEHTTLLMRNDLALLKLEHPLNFSSDVQPIKLPEQDQTVPLNQSATLIGWGQIDGHYTVPNDLMKVNLTIFDYPYCDSYNSRLNFSNAENICDGNSDNTAGQCTGDSGGPIFIDGVQWGIVSWSIKPCLTAPGVFTTTSVFIDWIKNVMASN